MNVSNCDTDPDLIPYINSDGKYMLMFCEKCVSQHMIMFVRRLVLERRPRPAGENPPELRPEPVKFHD